MFPPKNKVLPPIEIQPQYGDLVTSNDRTLNQSFDVAIWNKIEDRGERVNFKSEHVKNMKNVAKTQWRQMSEGKTISPKMQQARRPTKLKAVENYKAVCHVKCLSKGGMLQQIYNHLGGMNNSNLVTNDIVQQYLNKNQEDVGVNVGQPLNDLRVKFKQGQKQIESETHIKGQVDSQVRKCFQGQSKCLHRDPPNKSSICQVQGKSKINNQGQVQSHPNNNIKNQIECQTEGQLRRRKNKLFPEIVSRPDSGISIMTSSLESPTEVNFGKASLPRLKTMSNCSGLVSSRNNMITKLLRVYPSTDVMVNKFKTTPQTRQIKNSAITRQLNGQKSKLRTRTTKTDWDFCQRKQSFCGSSKLEKKSNAQALREVTESCDVSREGFSSDSSTRCQEWLKGLPNRFSGISSVLSKPDEIR